MKIPVVMQFDSSDCGVACASSICYHYGKEISISRLRDMMGTDAYGTSVNGLVSGLKSIGFEVRAVKAPKESIGDDPPHSRPTSRTVPCHPLRSSTVIIGAVNRSSS